MARQTPNFDRSRSRSSPRARPRSSPRELTAQQTQSVKDLLNEIEQLESGPNHQCRKQEIIRVRLGAACGYSVWESSDAGFPVSPWTVAEDLRCSVFLERSRIGRSYQQQNSQYCIENHIRMVLDIQRVAAFEQAILRVARRKRVLDVGAGAFCLLGRIALKAGAARVDAIEQSKQAVDYAVELFKMEIADAPFPPLRCLRSTCAALCPDQMQLILPPRPHSNDVRQYNILIEPAVPTGADDVKQQFMDAFVASEQSIVARRTETSAARLLHSSGLQDADDPFRFATDCTSLRCTVLLWPDAAALHEADDAQHGGEAEPSGKLEVHQGLSSALSLQGGYDLVVHELLGHVASAEGVALTISDIIHRGLCQSQCVFIPSAAATFFAPTSALELSVLEQALNCFHNNGRQLQSQTKYNVLRFNSQAFLAAPQALEKLEFRQGADLVGRRHHSVEFTTTRGGVFDGLHFHLWIELDECTNIDTLATETSWSTTYVKLLDEGIWMPCGSRIVCDCWVCLDTSTPRYSVSVRNGELGREVFIAGFAWDGS